MLAYIAKTRNKKFIIQLTKETKVHVTLRDFVRSMNGLIKMERK